jgi:hypothetical protein
MAHILTNVLQSEQLTTEDFYEAWLKYQVEISKFKISKLLVKTQAHEKAAVRPFKE